MRRNNEHHLLHILERLNEVADVWIFPVEWLPLVASALLDEPVGDDAELLPVDESLPVWV